MEEISDARFEAEGDDEMDGGRMTNGRASAGGTHFPISFTATVVPRSVALYTFPKLPLPTLTHSRLDDRSAGSKSGPSIAVP